MRIALAQINPTVGDLTGNARKIIGYLNEARAKDADLVVFPELAICGYPPEDLLYKEHFVSDNLKALQTVVKAAKGLTAIVGFVDRDKKGQIYNAAAVIHDGRIKAVCHKTELPNYGVFDEKRYFVPDGNDYLFKLGSTVLGVNICEDIWKHDGLYRKQAKAGARLLINISASPYHDGKFKIRQQMLRSRAREAKTFVCYVNVVGGQDELVFDGGSMVLNPQGRIAALGKQFAEDLIVVDLEDTILKKLNSKKMIFLSVKKKAKRMPIAKQLNPPLPRHESIYAALVLGTRDYVRKNGFQKAVVGLSGGIDSALVAVIACDAIGKENVFGVTMPSRFSSEGTRADAKTVAKNLGIKCIEAPIESVFNTYADTLKDHFAGRPADSTEENLQARIRGNILMAFSNKFGWLVLTTGNKSEIAVGYCTLYGDMSGGFAVIKDVPKTMVYELAKFRNDQTEKKLIPESVFTRPPTAELRENQTDQDSLPPYDVLDVMLKAYVEEHQALSQMTKKFNHPEMIKKVIRMVDYSEYKRRQAAPGVKITPRAFGKDWRLPITNKYKES